MTVSSNAKGQWLRPKVEGLAPAARGGHCCACVDTKVLVFGGADRAPTPYEDLYSLELGEQGQYMWTRVQPCLAGGVQMHSRMGASLTVIGSDVFMYGGQEPSTGTCFSDVLKLDTETWSWTKVPAATGAPPPRHSHCAGLLHGNCLLIYGGASQTNSMFGDVWVFNTATREWSRIEVAGETPVAREMATGTMLDDTRMLVFGGRSADGSILGDMVVLDMTRCSWRRHAEQHLKRCAHSASLLPRDCVSSALLERLQSCHPPASHSSIGAPEAVQHDSSESAPANEAPVLAIFGGFTGDEVASDMVLVDTATMSCLQIGQGAWETDARAPVQRFAHASALIPSIRGAGKKAVLVFGGVNPAQDLNDVCVWYP